jgi:hypothetical protein
VFQTIFEFLFKYRPLVFTEGRLTFQSPIGISLLIPVVVLVVALAMWTYRSVAGKATDRDRVVLATLRALALAIIAFALARPVLLVSSVVPQQNYVAVVFDDSRSMRIIDGDEARSAFVPQAFGPGSALVAQLEERFQLRYFGFSASTERLNDPGMLSFAGSNTRIAPALDRVREDLAALPLSGIVVVTDGADNSALGMTESLLALQAAQVPVYTVGLGNEHYAKDVELSRVSTPRTVLKGASLVVDLLVSQSGYAGQTVQVVVEDDGRIVGSEEVTLPPDGEPVPCPFHGGGSGGSPVQVPRAGAGRRDGAREQRAGSADRRARRPAQDPVLRGRAAPRGRVHAAPDLCRSERATRRAPADGRE